MAVEAAHQAALKKDDKADPRTIDGAASFPRMDASFDAHNALLNNMPCVIIVNPARVGWENVDIDRLGCGTRALNVGKVQM
ncbi:hypothetical protein GCM10025772_09710 [Ferrimonas gelatinilytica]|uniref:Uncharacterized protein n=1 Tax=Ferrimonas gelatinilytica TaxID=1255257 RepID=A0ABP9RZY2_9GAMM